MRTTMDASFDPNTLRRPRARRAPWAHALARLVMVPAMAMGAVAGAAELRIDEGVVVKFGEDAELVVRDRLVASRGVVFTSIRDGSIGGTTANGAAPAAGDWRGILVEPSVGPGSLVLSGADIRYAGGDDGAALTLSQHDYSLSNLTVRDSVRGIRVTDGGVARFNGLSLLRNIVGLEADRGARPDITASELVGNFEYAVLNFSPVHVLNARGNWWGAASGPHDPIGNPSGEGDAVSQGVDYASFQVEAPLLNCRVDTVDGSYVVRQPRVRLALSCPGAVSMRVSESPEFSGAPTIAFQHELSFDLSPAPGLRQVRVAFIASTGRDVVVSLPQPVDFAPGLPTVAFVSPAAGAELVADTLLRASIVHDAPIQTLDFLVDGQPIGRLFTAPWQLTWALADVADGDYQLSAVATDVYGGQASASIDVSVARPPVDVEGPAISGVVLGSVAVADGLLVQSPGILQFNVEDPSGIQGVEVRVGGEAVAGSLSGTRYSAFLDFQAVPNGSHPLSLRATDRAGNSTDLGFQLNVQLPVPGAPVIATPVAGQVLSSPQVLVSGSAMAGSQVRIHLGNTPVGEPVQAGADGSFSRTVALPDEGSFSVSAQASNSRGTGPRSAEVGFSHVAPGPQLSLLQPPQGAVLETDTELLAVASDPSGIARVEFHVDATLIGTATAPPYAQQLSIAGLADGAHTLRVVAYNSRERSTEVLREFRVERDQTPPPVLTPYTGRIDSVSPALSYGEQPVQISGRAVARDGGDPVPNALLGLVFKVGGFERRINVTTNDSGSFAFTFLPQSSDAGTYRVGARHPEEAQPEFGGEFTINRLVVKPERIALRAAHGVPMNVPIQLTASQGTGVRGVRIEALASEQPSGALPPGIQVTASDRVDVAAGATVTVNVGFTGSESAGSSGSVVLTVRSLDTGNAHRGRVTIDYQLNEARPSLFPRPSYIDTGVRRGQSVTEALRIENRGVAPAHNLRLAIVAEGGQPLPAWLQLSSPAEAGGLDVGETATVQVTATPPAGVPDGIYRARLQVTADNWGPQSLPIAVAVTDSEEGAVSFHVANIYTDTVDADGNVIPGLAGARIRLEHEDVVTQVYTATTDANGRATLAGVPAGRYTYRASAPNHVAETGRVLVRPATTVEESVFLDYAAVTIEWSVTETTIQDRYDVVLEAVFQADVPAPVVLMQPLSINLPDMQVGEEITGEITITNYGLIRADNVAFTPPGSDAYYRIEFLGEVPNSLAAKERITLPYRVTAIGGLPGLPGMNSMSSQSSGAQSNPILRALNYVAQSSAACWHYRNGASVRYDYECANGQTRAGSAATAFNKAYGGGCGGSGGAIGIGGGGGGGGGWGAGGGGARPVPMGPQCIPDADDGECSKPGGSAGG